MSSCSSLLSLSGFEYAGPSQYLRFTPRHTPDNFKSFFTGPEGWGNLTQTRKGNTQRNEVHVAHGKLPVASVRVDPLAKPSSVKVSLGRAAVSAELKASMDGYLVQFSTPVVVKQGNTLVVSLG